MIMAYILARYIVFAHKYKVIISGIRINSNVYIFTIYCVFESMIILYCWYHYTELQIDLHHHSYVHTKSIWSTEGKFHLSHFYIILCDSSISEAQNWKGNDRSAINKILHRHSTLKFNLLPETIESLEFMHPTKWNQFCNETEIQFGPKLEKKLLIQKPGNSQYFIVLRRRCRHLLRLHIIPFNPPNRKIKEKTHKCMQIRCDF